MVKKDVINEFKGLRACMRDHSKRLENLLHIIFCFSLLFCDWEPRAEKFGGGAATSVTPLLPILENFSRFSGNLQKKAFHPFLT